MEWKNRKSEIWSWGWMKREEREERREIMSCKMWSLFREAWMKSLTEFAWRLNCNDSTLLHLHVAAFIRHTRRWARLCILSNSDSRCTGRLTKRGLVYSRIERTRLITLSSSSDIIGCKIRSAYILRDAVLITLLMWQSHFKRLLKITPRSEIVVEQIDLWRQETSSHFRSHISFFKSNFRAEIVVLLYDFFCVDGNSW